jgi:murein DD-endopeptidase MepM/ murein hydrolase activator NlpD
MQLKLLVALFFISLNSFSQKRSDSIEFVYKYPFRVGYIYHYNPEEGRIICPSGIESIYSKESDVFALMEGKVRRIFNTDSTIDSDNLLVVNKDTCVVYGNIATLFKKVGDIVYKGELIGKVGKDNTSDRYELVFCILINNKPPKNYADFLRKYNK